MTRTWRDEVVVRVVAWVVFVICLVVLRGLAEALDEVWRGPDPAPWRIL